MTALPDFRSIARSVDPNHGVQRFHLRVIPVVAAEFGGVGLRRIAKGNLHVPLFFQLYSRGIGIPADLDIILKRCLGVEPISLGFRPRDSQGIAACLGVLEMIGNHGEPVVKLHNGDDAFHGAHLRIVPAFRRGTGFVLLAWIPDFGLGTVNRRMQRRCVKHPGQLHVDGILGTAVDLGRDVAARHRMSDKTELLGVLELLFIHCWQGCRNRSEACNLAVAQALAVGWIDDQARLGLERGRVNAPLLRSIRHQYLSHLRTGDAQFGVIKLHRAAADDPHELLGTEGVLVAVDLGVSRNPFDRDLRPVRVHFLSDDERQGRHGALTHFRSGAQDRDRAVRGDAHPRGDGSISERSFCGGHQAHAVISERKAERHSAQTGEHAAARQVAIDHGHGFSPPSPHARWPQ